MGDPAKRARAAHPRMMVAEEKYGYSFATSRSGVIVSIPVQAREEDLWAR